MRAYLDHASTSPLRPEALDAMLPWLNGRAGIAADPGRVHTEGRVVRHAIEVAREQVAALVGARSREVVFTSGATEAANAAVWGAMSVVDPGSAIACAPVEHSCVRDASARHRVIALAVDSVGRLDVASVEAAIDDGARLVHCQWANHEVATLQPVAEVAALCRERGVLLHVDAAQAVGHVPVDFTGAGIDLMSVSGHKFGAPTGMGALIVRRGLRLDPLVVGGAQERARRAGMENVAAIAGFGAAASAVAGSLVTEGPTQRAFTETILRAATAVEGITPFGDLTDRAPHIVCFGIGGVEAEPELLGLDQEGVAAHSGSSCSAESLEPSPVLEAMGVDAERSLRVSVGWSTSPAEVDLFVTKFAGVVQRLRALGSSAS
ncbi:MAG: cysteine desulfurase family protein [Acidimicrobiia bacterium]